MNKVNFFAYGTLRYGVGVGSAEFELDGFDEILTGAGTGIVFGPHVRGWNYDGGTLGPVNKVNFYAYSTLRYGVNVEAGSVDGDCYDEFVTGPGPGQIFGAHLRGWNFDNGVFSTIAKISIFVSPTAQYGLNVAAGDIDGDDFAEIVAALGPNGANPSTYSGFNYDGTTVTAMTGFPITPPEYTYFYGGEVGTGDVNDDVKEEFIIGAGSSPLARNMEVYAYVYDPVAGNLTRMSNNFLPFLAPYGTNVAAGALGF